MRILVVYGGEGLSEEAEVSMQSGMAVFQAAQTAGLDVDQLVLNKDNVGQFVGTVAGYDLVLPILHGRWGEDGRLQRLMEDNNISFVGSGSRAMEKCWDKAVYKNILDQNGISTPKFRQISDISELDQVDFGWPRVIKPVSGGSSLGVMVVRDKNNLDKDQVAESLSKYGQLLVEEFIKGDEISVGVLGEETLPVIEIIPPPSRYFDYDAKYKGEAQEIVPAQNVSEAMQTQAKELAVRIHKLMGCWSWSRTDMIIRDGLIYVLETNTIPGMTAGSLYPKIAQAAGYNLSELIKRLIEV